MIPTPLYSENPKGFLRAENFDAEDGIPLEKGSGFGNHLMRDVLTSSIVIHYIEVTATTYVDVSARYSDLHLRVVGSGEGIVTTVLGQLPQGRRLHMDVQAAENASTLIIGGVTYELPAGGGVLTFISTSSGWSAPLKLDFDLRIANDLTVDGDTTLSDAYLTGTIFPRPVPSEDFFWTKYVLPPNGELLLPRGLMIGRRYGSYGSIQARIITEDFNSWQGITQEQEAVTFFSDGINYRLFNNNGTNNATFYVRTL